MILYRFSGRCEQWAGCGMLIINHIVLANRTAMLSTVNKQIRQFKKDNKTYRFKLEQVTLTTNKTLVIKAFEKQDMEELVVDKDLLKTWTNDHDPTIKNSED